MLSSSASYEKEQNRRSTIMRVISGSVICVIAAIALSSCGGGSASSSPQSVTPPEPLTSADVQSVINAAALSVNVPIVVAVTDRLGNVLAVFDVPGAPTSGVGNFGNTENADELAVALARTAAFFSNSQAPLSSRTVRFISGIHFPPGVDNAPNAALYAIENTNRGCPLDTSLTPGVQVAKGTLIDGTIPGLGIITGKGYLDDHDPTAVNPGGVPIFKNNFLVGGIGVVADANALGSNLASEVAEYAALSGGNAGNGLTPTPVPLPPPGAVVIDGVTLPFVNQTTIPAGVSRSNHGPYTVSAIAGMLPEDDMFLLSARAGSALTQMQVTQIVNNAVATAKLTRALIRLPLESRTRMSIAVSDTDGTLLAVYRMNDGTIFSLDVAVAKARNAVYFSSNATTVAQDLPGVPAGTAVTNRTIGFGAQPFFPPGINGSSPGPFYNLYLNDVAHPCTQGSQSPPIANPSGIVFFPGSLPLYINGTLVGGLGVSGDGVDQDDYVTAGGAAGLDAPAAIQADQVVIDNVRLPYLRFPRDPTD